MKRNIVLVLCLFIGLQNLDAQWKFSPAVEVNFYQLRAHSGDRDHYQDLSFDRNRGARCFITVGMYAEKKIREKYSLEGYLYTSFKGESLSTPSLIVPSVVKSSWGFIPYQWTSFLYSGLNVNLLRELSPRWKAGLGASINTMSFFDKQQIAFPERMTNLVHPKVQLGACGKIVYKMKSSQMSLTYNHGLVYLIEKKDERLFNPMPTLALGYAWVLGNNKE